MSREFEAQRSFADQVAEATGLAPVFASGVIERCCRRAGVLVTQLKPSDLETILPHLEASLLVYNKSGHGVLAALERLKRLATDAAVPSTTIFPLDDDARSARHESFIRERSEFPAWRRAGSR